MPPTNIINGYTAEQLVAEMDHADVEWGMVHRSTYLGIGNEWVADCVRRFPDRLHGLAHVEEWLVQPQPDESISKIERAVKELGLHGIQWLCSGTKVPRPDGGGGLGGIPPVLGRGRRPRHSRLLHVQPGFGRFRDHGVRP